MRDDKSINQIFLILQSREVHVLQLSREAHDDKINSNDLKQ